MRLVISAPPGSSTTHSPATDARAKTDRAVGTNGPRLGDEGHAPPGRTRIPICVNPREQDLGPGPVNPSALGGSPGHRVYWRCRVGTLRRRFTQDGFVNA